MGCWRAQAAARLQADTGNITAMLEQAATRALTDKLADALWGLTEYWKFTGFIQPALARVAQEEISVHGTADEQARTWFALGDLARHRYELDGAQAQYEQALALYRQADMYWGKPTADWASGTSPGSTPT